MQICMIWVDRHDETQAWEPNPLHLQSTTPMVASAGANGFPAAIGSMREHNVEAVVVLCRPDSLGLARYFATGLTSQLPALRVAVQQSAAGKLPSMAVAAHSIAAGLPASETLAALEATLRTSASGVWLSNLARLKSPTPTFGQYLRSLLPGPGVIVTHTPQPIIRNRSWHQPTPLSKDSILLVSQTSHAPEMLTSAFHGATSQILPLNSHVKEAYGAQGVEFLVTQPLLSKPTPTHSRCSACGDELFSLACPFCHIIARRQGVHA